MSSTREVWETDGGYWLVVGNDAYRAGDDAADVLTALRCNDERGSFGHVTAPVSADKVRHTRGARKVL